MNVDQASSVDLIDTHAHLDDPVFDRDREHVIAAAAAKGVGRIMNVGYRPSRWTTTRALAERHAGIFPILGLHPHHADEYDDSVGERLLSAITDSGAVAIGEIGLDYFRDGPDPPVQRRAFVAQLEIARRLKLPIVIHQRAAEAALIEVLSTFPDLPTLVLHSFDASTRLATFASERGYFVGVGGLATKNSSSTLRSVLKDIPLTHVLLETDSPYLSPPREKEHRNTPSNLPEIARRLASIWDTTGDDLARASTTAAETAFKIGSIRT
jgi:TatD DNase family protein